jgi:hypothetical protein
LPALTQNGTRTFPHVLQRALFPLAAGRLDIPASQLTYTLPRSTSFFSREESAVMRANDVALHVRPLPRTGQPDDFSGAVGVLGLRASVDTPDARVGEPVLLTVDFYRRRKARAVPDLDQYVKLVMDAANKIAWSDDAQVVGLRTWKYDSRIAGGEERTEVVVTVLG